MAKIKRAFVTGFPVMHSRSPHIHRYWLKHYGLSGQYQAIEKSIDDFPHFMQNLRSGEFCGGNITLPHKKTAFLLADWCDDVATSIGAANTVWLENDRLCASNTDSYGFAANLDDCVLDWAGGTALVLGAGGAARAVLYALKVRRFHKIIVLNRTPSRAQQLADFFGHPIVVDDWQTMHHHSQYADLVVNTTSLGMKNQTTDHYDTPLFDLAAAKSNAIATDVIYTPLMTPFLQQAQRCGFKTVDGLGMLLHQAVPGFARWFGIKPQVTEKLRTEILSTLTL